ncbi:IS66 family transposase [Granulosicoccus antarcticus]|uniref:Uncharacterized protein n=1 Tax=Granulosicoccus antarcticus IMCC3135 TaxID=1192854 RepID=A0A2Z2NML4_9GAMM|nr:transposase [Granulosicoccus antarcticus]ASJ72453.1 hypothetical protein IMCC3135_11815 [Granulosicoccus antarcticus IMCC3135]
MMHLGLVKLRLPYPLRFVLANHPLVLGRIKALFYAQNNWEALTAFMKNASLPVDNNPVESAIRPFALGRKNWLYTASPRGAKASAFMYTLVESAKACGLEPRAYLQALLERYPFATTEEERRQLLPMFIKIG